MCAALTLSMDQKVEPVLSKVKCYKCGVAIYEVRLCLPVCVCAKMDGLEWACSHARGHV